MLMAIEYLVIISDVGEHSMAFIEFEEVIFGILIDNIVALSRRLTSAPSLIVAKIVEHDI
jgi:hypothetical protein